MIAHDPTTRRYLEQMMIRFTALGVPVDQAANELVEIEAHIVASELDPFDELGDPQELASSLVSEEQRKSLYSRKLRQDLIGGLMLAAVFCLGIQAVLSLFDAETTSVPRMLVVLSLIHI